MPWAVRKVPSASRLQRLHPWGTFLPGWEYEPATWAPASRSPWCLVSLSWCYMPHKQGRDCSPDSNHHGRDSQYAPPVAEHLAQDSKYTCAPTWATDTHPDVPNFSRNVAFRLRLVRLRPAYASLSFLKDGFLTYNSNRWLALSTTVCLNRIYITHQNYVLRFMKLQISGMDWVQSIIERIRNEIAVANCS